GAGLPLEGDAFSFVVPNRGGAAAVEHQDHLLEQLALRSEFLPRRYLADIAVVRGARCLVIDIHAEAAAPRPWLEVDGAQIAHILRADDVEALVAYPAQIGRVLLGCEFLCQLFRNNGVFGHGFAPCQDLVGWVAFFTRPNNCGGVVKVGSCESSTQPTSRLPG